MLAREPASFGQENVVAVVIRLRDLAGMSWWQEPGARFSKVPIINGPGKLTPFTLKIEVSIVLHLT